MVERFFRDITNRRLRRGVLRNVPDVIDAIGDYILHHNENPKPFVWTKEGIGHPRKGHAGSKVGR